MNNRATTYRFRKNILAVIILFVVSSVSIVAQPVSDSTKAGLKWVTEKLSDGIYWKRYRGDDLYDSKQSINMIEVVLDSANAEFNVAFHPDSLFKTSEFAEKHHALAAINGSYFNRDHGGSLVFLKVDDVVISEGVPKRDLHTESGGVGWSAGSSIQILKKPARGWKTAEHQTIISSGPLLIYNSEKQTFKNDTFHQNRHPRSAVAISNDNHLFLVTVDGRSFQSYGMTIPELTDFLFDLGAVSALNLDGGGSTTMWIRNKNGNGIVNYPSDNLEFDHNGERRVSNALLILLKE